MMLLQVIIRGGAAIADLDNDGKNDLAVVNNAENTLSIFGNKGVTCIVTSTDVNGCASVDTVALTIIPCTVLPVNFISVNANRIETGVEINWEVTGEGDIKNYTVERSLNSRDFFAAGTLNVNSYRTQPGYHFNDANSPNTIVYYRIKSMGKSGDFLIIVQL